MHNLILQGSVHNLILRGSVHNLILQGSVHNLILRGSVHNLILQGSVHNLILQGSVHNLILQGSVHNLILQGGVHNLICNTGLTLASILPGSTIFNMTLLNNFYWFIISYFTEKIAHRIKFNINPQVSNSFIIPRFYVHSRLTPTESARASLLSTHVP